MKKRAPPGEANCVVVRHTASDGSKGLHLRAIATMAPGTQLTITFDVGAKISILRVLYCFPRRFEEPTEAKADAMDVGDDNGAAPMLVFYHRFSSRPPQVPRRWHRPAAQPASAADQLSARTSWTSSFVLLFPARPHVGRAGPWAPRPSGSERSSSRPSCSSCTVTPTSSSLPRVSFPLSPQLIRSCSR